VRRFNLRDERKLLHCGFALHLLSRNCGLAWMANCKRGGTATDGDKLQPFSAPRRGQDGLRMDWKTLGEGGWLAGWHVACEQA